MRRINFFIVALVMLVLYSCQKEESFDLKDNIASSEESNMFNSDKTPKELKTEFYNHFASFEKNGNKEEYCVLNPLKHEIDWNSGYVPDYFGENSMIFDIIDSSFSTIDLGAKQVLCTIEDDGRFTMKSLIYIANRSFYEENRISPRLFNFTGKVVVSDLDDKITTIYYFDLGEITGGETGEKTKVPKEGCDHGPSWWDHFTNWIGGIGNSLGGFFTNGNGTGGNDGSIGSYNSSGWSGGWGNNSSNGGSDGSNGNGGFSGIGSCGDPNYWSSVDFLVKKDYINAISELMDAMDVYTCNDPFAPEGEACFDSQDILCYSVTQDCFDGTAFEIGDLVDCMYGLFAQPLDDNSDDNTDVSCNENALSFIDTYGLTSANGEPMSIFELKMLIGTSLSSCGNQAEFDEYVFEKLAIHYSSIYDENNTSEEDAGFHDRTLNCESFNFVSQLSGSGQIACVEGLYLSKNFGSGAYAYTDEFCGHFTVPKVRYNGQVISSGQAADCAAWASNAAAFTVGAAFASSNYQMMDSLLKGIFRFEFKRRMQTTSCGYGTMTECQNATCLSPPQNASWNSGFFQWLEEQLFGCD